jgi:hypothetical protein
MKLKAFNTQVGLEFIGAAIHNSWLNLSHSDRG